MKSLSRNFLLGVGGTSVAITVLVTFAVLLTFRGQMAERQKRRLDEYLGQRLINVSSGFNAIAAIQKSAREKLIAEMDRLSPAQIATLLDRDFPLRADGTRRSRPAQFDGEFDRSDRYVEGMAAFIGGGRSVSADERRALVAAYGVVHDVGVGVDSYYKSFYFVTPTNKAVIYAPTRPDRLMFYRETAPATLDFSGEEMMAISSPTKNPAAETRCTSLQNLIQDKGGQRLSTACLTPVWYRGRYIGALGSSLPMGAYMPEVVKTSMKNVTALLARSQGDVIAYPGHTLVEGASAARLAQVERTFGIRDLMARIRATGLRRGVLRSPDGEHLVAFGRIPGPDWWLLLTYPEAEMRKAALHLAMWVLGFGLLAALVQTALIVWLARDTIVAPLRRLAESRHTDTPPSSLLRRRDEIGALGRALQDERDKTRVLLASLEERVTERTAELERALTEKDRFLANMSHELRTPLNGVIAVSETLAELQRFRRAKEMARLIVSSSRLLEHVLSDILDFSRLEAGEIALANEPFDLRAVLSRTAELHRAVALGKGLTLSCEVAPDVAHRYMGDSVRVTQIVSNLLSNAVKFTERGEVRLCADVDGGDLRVTVTDTGMGFDADVQSRLFQRFEQADPSISRRFGGSGLGLAICRSLSDAMKGRISATSSPGGGSTFTLRLPLLSASVDDEDGSSWPAREEEALAGGRVRVLLAEDHPTNQKVVELILEAADVELTIVEDGRAALEALNGAGFDLVLMDMQMPHLDGLSATRLWRETEALRRLPRTPVVMLTANALPDHVHASLQAGADRHLAKPIRAADLLMIVETLAAEADTRRAVA